MERATPRTIVLLRIQSRAQIIQRLVLLASMKIVRQPLIARADIIAG